MSNFKSVRIDSIEPNRIRNFKLYPIVKEQVQALADSYDETGDFGVIPVRPLEGGGYEQAAGHHRLAAMKKLGHTHVNVIEEYYDDDMMIKIMVNENSRQQGNNAPAALDSLSAVTYQVAYYLLLSDTVEEFEEVLNSGGASPKSTKNAFNTAKTKISNGDPVPHQWLKAYAHDGIAGERVVRDLSSTLQDSGELGRIYKRVQARVNEEMAAQEAEEKAAELARIKAERLAEKERLENEAAQKAAREAAKKAKASQKAAAEARAKDMERLAKQKAVLRDKEAKKREQERLKADADREERGRRKSEAKASADAAKLAAKGLNPAVLHMLRSQRHQEAFRKLVTTEEGKKAFPESSQVAVVNAMLGYLGDDINTKGIQEYLSKVMVKNNAALRRMMEDREAREVKASVTRKVFSAIDEFRLTASKTASSLSKLSKVLDDEKTRDFALAEIASDKQLAEMINYLENMVLALRQNLTLRQSQYDNTTIDAANESRGKIVNSL